MFCIKNMFIDFKKTIKHTKKKQINEIIIY